MGKGVSSYQQQNTKMQLHSELQVDFFKKYFFTIETAMRGGLEWEWEGIKFFAAFLDQYLDT